MVVDPRRDVDIYLKLADQSQSRISHIFETHRNEDYVIGSLELQYHIPQVKICHSKETDFKYGDQSLGHDPHPEPLRGDGILNQGRTPLP